MHVVGRHQDEAALNRARIEVARELADDDGAFMLVTVVSPFDDDGRPSATPQASSCGECGNITKPICRPCLSKSIVVKAVVGRLWLLLIVVLSWSAGCTRAGNFDNMRKRQTGAFYDL
jgi:hypothetical protein